jgi:ABC-type multidrug transport system ATPase subunit
MELVADSMLIIDRGRKVVEGRSEDLLNPEKVRVEIQTDEKEKAIAIISGVNGEYHLLSSANGVVMLEMPRADIPGLNRMLAERGINIFSIRPKHSLEDFFLSLTKN